METPLWRRLAQVADRLGGDWRPVGGAGVEIEPPTEPAASGAAERVEDPDRFRLHDVGEGSTSRFRYFLDGIEMSRVCGYLGVAPLVHGYVAAVIRRREERAFTTWAAEELEVLAFPYDRVPRERLLDLGFPEEALLDSGGEDVPFHPLRLAERGRAAVKRARERLEARLARSWVRARIDDGWLLVDGGLAVDRSLAGSGRAIGLVKSHRTQFLEPEAMGQVLAASAGQRSSVFRPLRPEIGEVYSWYLRLRPPTGHDIYWALARVEGAADDRTTGMADEVSCWLLHETAPIALPDPRWHVLLYPIRDCEAYLRARMPTLSVG